MEISFSQSLLLFLFSLMFVGSTTPLIRKLAIRLRVLDNPNEAHKTHNEPIPYLGGVAIVFGVLVTTYGALALFGNLSIIGLASTVLIPAVFMSVIGLVDDIKNLSPWPRFIVQNLVGVAISMTLVATDSFGSPTGSRTIDILISLIWIVGITNSINFFDNVDGGASGTVAISSFFLFLLSLQGNQYFIASLSIVLSGSTIGFLLWNKPPARIYMGDAGALFLGILIATLTLRLEPNPINKFVSFTIPFFLLAIPILDTSTAVISRVRKRISPLQGGKDHLSHRLMRKKYSKRSSVSILWSMSTIYGLGALLISNLKYEQEIIFCVPLIIVWIFLLIFFLREK